MGRRCLLTVRERLVDDARDVPRLEIRGLRKQFGTVVANDDVTLSIYAGEIVVLLGENGAGKSTLLRSLAGLLQPDAGEIRIDGHLSAIAEPADALCAGIGTVLQGLALVPTFTVVEQLRLAGWRPGHAPDPRTIGVDPAATIESLPLGDRQRVEIARAMLSASRVLLLDEPTAVLAPPEVETLFANLRQIRERGTAVVLVTHKLREALAIGDRIVAMRGGRIAGELTRMAGSWPDRAESALLDLMFGPTTGELDTSALGDERMPAGPPLLRVEALRAGGIDQHVRLDDISFELNPGEIVAVAGVDGNGQRELAQTLAGFLSPLQGEIAIGGRSIAGLGPAVAKSVGIGFLTDDRLSEGTVPSRSLTENLALTRLGDGDFVRRGVLRRRAMRRDAQVQIDRFDIRPPDPAAPVSTLSGGNVQKLMLARAFATEPRVLVCLKPTSGLDARTTAKIHGELRTFADGGRAVLLFSNEVDEVLALGDRVGAMYRGRLSPLPRRRATSVAELGRIMVGAA